jgi:hypothetical protein
MKKHYLHLSVYRCDKCEGPVVAGSVATRENEISRETEKREVGAICLSCGYRQSPTSDGVPVRHVLPMDWPPAGGTQPNQLVAAFAKALKRAELH